MNDDRDFEADEHGLSAYSASPPTWRGWIWPAICLAAGFITGLLAFGAMDVLERIR